MYARRTLCILTSALAVGVCVYISYISSDVEAASLAINFGFLGVMLAAILIAVLAGLIRLIRISKELSRAADIARSSSSEEKIFEEKDLFRNKFLNSCFSQYSDMVRRHPDGSCDIADFINEDMIDTYIHLALLDMVSDFLTSLGILGTFIGLVIGLRSFNPSGYEQMADSISPLIDGIKVAFVTSIYGIALSLPFSLELHSELSEMEHCLDNFIETYYLYVHPSHEVDSAAKMLEQRKEQEDLVNSFARQQEAAVEQICTTIMDDIHADLDNTFQTLSKSVQQLGQAQADYLDFMDRTVNQLQQSFAGLQNQVEQADQYQEQTLTSLFQSQQDAFRIADEQKETYQDYIRFMYDSLEQFSDVWKQNSEKLQEYSDEIAKLGPVQSNIEVRNDIAALSNQVKELRQRQATTEDLAINQDETEQLLESMNRRLSELERLSAEPALFRRKSKR